MSMRTYADKGEKRESQMWNMTRIKANKRESQMWNNADKGKKKNNKKKTRKSKSKKKNANKSIITPKWNAFLPYKYNVICLYIKPW